MYFFAYIMSVGLADSVYNFKYATPILRNNPKLYRTLIAFVLAKSDKEAFDLIKKYEGNQEDESIVHPEHLKLVAIVPDIYNVLGTKATMEYYYILSNDLEWHEKASMKEKKKKNKKAKNETEI